MSITFIVAAALGGLVRFLAEYHLPPVGSSGFPRATLLVNVAGSLVLGIAWYAPADVRLAVGTAFCGALTTFSGVALQLLRRARAGAPREAALYAVVTIGAGLAAAAAGLAIGARFVS